MYPRRSAYSAAKENIDSMMPAMVDCLAPLFLAVPPLNWDFPIRWAVTILVSRQRSPFLHHLWVPAVFMFLAYSRYCYMGKVRTITMLGIE